MSKIQVVTYVSPAQAKISICPDCSARLKATDAWPRDASGREYAQVMHGLHCASCDICKGGQAEE